MRLDLSLLERAELVRRAASPGGRDRRRARLILALAKGATWEQVMRELKCSRGFVARWAKRFRDGRLGAMQAHHRGSGPRVVTPALEERILRAGRQLDAAGAPRWSTRALGEHLGISHMTIHRIWVRHGVRS